MGAADQKYLQAADGSRVSLAGAWRYRIAGNVSEIGRGPFAPWDGAFTTMYNGMIAPLGPIGLAGVAWYQGESNVDRPAEYQTLLQVMMQDWRRAFDAPDLPFLIVQLPNYGTLRINNRRIAVGPICVRRNAKW